MKISALAGGVGGAKLVDGLAQCLKPEDLSVIVNTGDDFEHFGLYISPDIDTVCYALGGLSNEVTGWGRSQETWKTLEVLKKLGGPDWFQLGDMDLATHLERTRLLREGKSLSEITRTFCDCWGVSTSVFPMCNNPVQTMVKTKEKGWLPFQEYFVKYKCDLTMLGYRFEGIEDAELPQKAEEALLNSDWVIICPSNPFVSIEPILRIKRVTEILKKKNILAVSPIIDGKALKGPAAKMFSELGFIPSAYEVLNRYKELLNVFAVNKGDASDILVNNHQNIMIIETDIIMPDRISRRRLASELLEQLQYYGRGGIG